jgi:hypothetical protein
MVWLYMLKEYIMSKTEITPTSVATTPTVYLGLNISAIEHLVGRFLSSSSLMFGYCGWKIVDGIATPSKSKEAMAMLFNHSVSESGDHEWWGITEDNSVVKLRLPHPRSGVRYYAFVKNSPAETKFEGNHRIRWLLGSGLQNLLTPQKGDHVSGRITPLMSQFFTGRGVIVDRT